MKLYVVYNFGLLRIGLFQTTLTIFDLETLLLGPISIYLPSVDTADGTCSRMALNDAWQSSQHNSQYS